MNGLEFDAERHEYRFEGKLVPSVSSIIRELSMADLQFVDRAVLAEAAARGTAVHATTEWYDREGWQPEMYDLPGELLGPLLAWIGFRYETGFDPTHIEQRLYHPVFGYAGTADRLGWARGEAWVLDIKTSEPHDWHGVQLAGYLAPAIMARYVPHYAKRVSVYLDDNRWRMRRWASDEDWRVFFAHYQKRMEQPMTDPTPAPTPPEADTGQEVVRVAMTIHPDVIRAVDRITAWADSLAVHDDAAAAAATEQLRQVAGVRKRLEEARTRRKAPILDVSRRLDAVYKSVLDRVAEAEAEGKRQIGVHEQAKRAAAEAAARKAREDAAAEQERQRQAAEDAYKAGDMDAHRDAVFAEAMAVAPPAKKVARPAGISIGERWHAEVTDKVALIKAAAANPELYAQYLEPLMPALNKVAVQHHGAVEVPGVQMVAETSVGVR